MAKAAYMGAGCKEWSFDNLCVSEPNNGDTFEDFTQLGHNKVFTEVVKTTWARYTYTPDEHYGNSFELTRYSRIPR